MNVDDIFVCYIAGPFRGKDSWEMEQNIRRAEALALEVWRTPGCAAVCPHSNTRYFQGVLPDERWLDGDLAILKKCDGVLMTPDYQRSYGAKAELLFALNHSIPIFFDMEQVREHVELLKLRRENPESWTTNPPASA